MADLTTEFFERLEQSYPATLSDKVEATMRFDLEVDHKTDHWFLAIHGGRVHVSRERHDADCVIYAKKRLFDRLVTGETSMLAAVFRNELGLSGDRVVAITLRKIFPGRPEAADPRTLARQKKQSL